MSPSPRCSSSRRQPGSGVARASAIQSWNGIRIARFRRRAGDLEAVVAGDDDAARRRDLGGLGDAGPDHVPTLAAELQVAGALVLVAQVRKQVGAMHLDLVDDRVEVGLDGGVADREDVGHRHRPAVVDLRAQAQAAPGDPAGACHVVGDPLDQRLVEIAARAVALQRLADQRDAGIGHAQRLVAAADRAAARSGRRTAARSRSRPGTASRPSGRSRAGAGNARAGSGRETSTGGGAKAVTAIFPGSSQAGNRLARRLL